MNNRVCDFKKGGKLQGSVHSLDFLTFSHDNCANKEITRILGKNFLKKKRNPACIPFAHEIN